MRLAHISAPLAALVAVLALLTIIDRDLWLGGCMLIAAFYLAIVPLLDRWSRETCCDDAFVDGDVE